MRRLPRAVAAAGLIAATLLLMAPIAWHGSPIGHDSHLHLVWAAQFADSLAAGVLYPRWLPDVNAGLGNPTFVFYPPLLYYLAAAGYWLTGSVPRGLDLAAGLLLFLSGLAAYRYLRAGLGRAASLVGTVALMALPYRLLDLYERAAVAEFAAFVWPPLGLLALRALARASTFHEAGPPAVGLAGATAGLALTHLPSLVLWGPLLALAALAPASAAPTDGLNDRETDGRGATILRAWVALALGLGAAAVYLLPAFAERPLVQLEWLDWVARAEAHTLFSTDMPHREAMAAFNHRVSVLACWTSALAAVAAVAALWPGDPRPWRQGRGGAGLPVAGTAALAAITFGMMTSWSAPLWTTLPILPSIQFPWRLLLVLTPATALLVACAAARVTAAGTPAPARALGAAALLLFGVILVVSAREIVAPASLDTPQASRIAGDTAGAQDAAEYRPRGAPAAGFPRLPRAESLAPGGRAEVLAWTPARRVVVVEGEAAGRLRVATFLYAGWRGAIDGRPLPLEAGEAGVIEAQVPAGRHVVELRFGVTPVRAAGTVVSAISLAALIGWMVWGWRRTEARRAARGLRTAR